MVRGESVSSQAQRKHTARLVCWLGSMVCALLVLWSPAALADTPDNVSWTVSDPQTGATNVTYAFAFTTARTATITTVTVALPRGTGGTPCVDTVYGLGAGTAALVGDELSYTLTTAATIPVGTHIAISFAGLTNTSTAGSHAAAVTIFDDVEAVETQASQAVAFGSASTEVSVTVAETLAVVGSQASAQDPAAGPTVRSNAAGRYTVVAYPPGQGGFVTYVVTPGY